MKIRIALERCKGHQACVRSAPELFFIGEDGFARLRAGEDVAPEQAENALLAYDNCPEFAIEIVP
ncbi:MAG: h16 [Ramlibacter sp.]|nr:h16 [Ramlibacter sp.]